MKSSIRLQFRSLLRSRAGINVSENGELRDCNQAKGSVCLHNHEPIHWLNLRLHRVEAEAEKCMVSLSRVLGIAYQKTLATCRRFVLLEFGDGVFDRTHEEVAIFPNIPLDSRLHSNCSASTDGSVDRTASSFTAILLVPNSPCPATYGSAFGDHAEMVLGDYYFDAGDRGSESTTWCPAASSFWIRLA